MLGCKNTTALCGCPNDALLSDGLNATTGLVDGLNFLFFNIYRQQSLSLKLSLLTVKMLLIQVLTAAYTYCCTIDVHMTQSVCAGSFIDDISLLLM